jgi:hypothetical protein
VGVDEEEIDELGLSRRWLCQLVPAQPALVIIISLPIPQLLLTAAPSEYSLLACCLEIVIFVIYVRWPWGDKSGMFIVQL